MATSLAPASAVVRVLAHRPMHWRQILAVVLSVALNALDGFDVLSSAFATGSGPVSQCSAPRLMSFHGAVDAWKVSWQERNSSRSSGVAIPEALKKSSYCRIRCARAALLSPFGAMQ